MPNALIITDGLFPESLDDRGFDKLKANDLNALDGPLTARFVGGYVWPIIDIEVENAVCRIDVCGMSEAKSFVEISALIDINGVEFDPDDFWHD